LETVYGSRLTELKEAVYSKEVLGTALGYPIAA
jgi:hypothetical protein